MNPQSPESRGLFCRGLSAEVAKPSGVPVDNFVEVIALWERRRFPSPEPEFKRLLGAARVGMIHLDTPNEAIVAFNTLSSE
jgi:hypothetical protein